MVVVVVDVVGVEGSGASPKKRQNDLMVKQGIKTLMQLV